MNLDLILGIMAALQADARITALIGAGSAARIYDEIVPANTPFPHCYIDETRVGRDTWYMGGVNRDREVFLAVIFVGRNDTPTSHRDVVLLDKYADDALNGKVVAPGLVSFLRYSDMPGTNSTDNAQGTVEYFSVGGIYRALIQVS